MDWQAWHESYDMPDSSLARRLRVVQERIRLALDACPDGPLRCVSLCSGQGRDVLEVLADHPRRDDVRARLVELDPRSVAIARAAIEAAGLRQVEVIAADAALTDHYLEMVPADLVLVCGLFGNIEKNDIERTIDACCRLCKTGGTVIWTRHREEPDLVPLICHWFEVRGFVQEWLSEPGAGFGVGVHRFEGRPEPLVPGQRMFTFIGFDVLKGRDASA